MRISIFIAGLVLSAAFVFAQSPVERGKYLVESVGMCADCHTPMVSGQHDASKHLKGAVIGFQPIGEIPPVWRKAAPDISGTSPLWQRWGEEAFKKFLQTGLNPLGKPAGPPMPPYRLSAQDAAAVVAYLKTVK